VKKNNNFVIKKYKITIKFLLFVFILTNFNIKAANNQPVTSREMLASNVSANEVVAFAINNEFNSISVWTQNNRKELYASYFNAEVAKTDPNNAWLSQKINLNTSIGPVVDITFPYVAINNKNRGVLVWTQSNQIPSSSNIEYTVYLSYINGNELTPTWSNPRVLHSLTSSSIILHSSVVGISDEGLVVGAYAQSSTLTSQDGRIESFFLTDNGEGVATSQNIVLPNVNPSLYNPLATDPVSSGLTYMSQKSFYMEKTSGNAALIWTQGTELFTSVLTINPSPIWGTPVQIGIDNSSGNSNVFQIAGRSIAINKHGNMVASMVLSVGDVANNAIFQPFVAQRLNTESSWTSMTLNNLASAASAIAIDLNNNNRAITAFTASFNLMPSLVSSAQNIDIASSDNEWNEIRSTPNIEKPNNIAFADFIQISNNDQGDATLTYSVVEASGIPLTIVFNGTTNTWSVAPFELQATSLPFWLDVAKGSTNIQIIQQRNSFYTAAGAGIIEQVMANGSNIINIIGREVFNTRLPLSPNRPTDLKGQCFLTQYSLQGNLFAALSWVPSTDNTIVEQNIIRRIHNGIALSRPEVVATVPLTQSSYTDYNIPNNSTAMYVVSAEDSSDFQGISNEATVVCAV